MVRDTLPSQDASTHQIWNSYLKEYRRYAPDTKRDGRTVWLLYASQSSFGGIKKGSLDPTPGVKGVCKDRIFAIMVLYAQFTLIWYATWQLSEKKWFDLLTPAPGVKVKQSFAQCLLHHVTYSGTKIEVATFNSLGGDAFQESTSFDLWPWGQGHTKCCPVPSYSCDLFSNAVWSCCIKPFRKRRIYMKIHFLTLTFGG